MQKDTMLLVPILLIHFCLGVTTIDSSQFNLHYTDWISDTCSEVACRQTCLYNAALKNSADKSRQIISYCLNEWPSRWNIKTNNRDRHFTFAELREQNITSQQLYLWSAPIDLIEHYQNFLNQPAISNDTMATSPFYNCSLPWFGPSCEYTFDQDASDRLSLGEIIQHVYEDREESRTMTCYEHLQCSRGPAPLCLDWSEICDGHIDCLDGGRDEEHCWQLEMNYCQDNEYRCSNGQCIDGALFRDDPLYPDCIDGSDETSMIDRRETCSQVQPTFACEDVRCIRHRYQSIIDFLTSSCAQERGKLMKRAIFSIERNDSVSDLCQSALMCIARVDVHHGNFSCDEFCANQTCQRLIEENCPPFVHLPAWPILFGHVYFVYTNEQSYYDPFYSPPAPQYVCYTQKFCHEVPITTTLPFFNNATCRHFFQLPSFHGSSMLSTWSAIVKQVSQVFWACQSNINRSTIVCNKSIMYPCVNMSKCISIHRINDGIRDFFYGDDEQQLMTIEQINSLKPIKNWYQCRNSNTSIASNLVQNDFCNCPESCEDETDYDAQFITTHISFQTICDGFTELRPVMIDGREQTDETECEQWQCNNSYTRCNGYWNCPDGVDELNCNPSPLLNCSSDEHMCVSRLTNQFMCLSIKNASDGRVDCLGGTDEPQFCQTKKQEGFFQFTFYCESKYDPPCVYHQDLCDGSSLCDYGDDEQFCQENITFLSHLCQDENALIRSDVENYFCNTLVYSKPQIVYFSLDQVNTSTKHRETVQAEKSPLLSSSLRLESISRRQRHCHHGLDIQVRLDSEKNSTVDTCLCPPSYYGDTCQYQNQRVSLTLKLKALSDSWSTLFSIVVSLIDDDERFLSSHEQLTYLSIRDCHIKVHLSAWPK